jgi:hypothetical protein
VGGGRPHVALTGALSHQLLRGLRQVGGPERIFSRQGAADQQDGGLRIPGLTAEYRLPQMLLELTNVGMKLLLDAGHDTHLIPLWPYRTSIGG